MERAALEDLMEPVKTKELRGWVGPVEMKLVAWAGPAKKGELGDAMDLAKFFPVQVHCACLALWFVLSV